MKVMHQQINFLETPLIFRIQKIMIRNLIVVFTLFTCCQIANAQKASDVLENGVRVKNDRKIFIQYSKGELLYGVALSLTDESHPPDITEVLEDSLIYLVDKNMVSIYITPPLNPLKFSYTTETKEILDPINAAAVTGSSSIIELLNTVRPPTPPAPHGYVPVKCDTLFKFLEKKVEEIQSNLEDNQQKEVNTAFSALKSLSFNDQKRTLDSIAIIKNWKDSIEKHFVDLETQIKNAKEVLKSYDCGTKDMAFTIKYIFTNIFKEADEIRIEQKKRLDNLQTVFKLVEKTYIDASVGGTGLKWCLKLPSIPSKDGKIYLYTITVNESGYSLSDKKEDKMEDKREIVNVETKEVLKRTLRVRKFQLFVPEVSIGTAYTFFKYNTYGTTSDSFGIETNNLYVASPTENLVRNINLTTMINFNYYIPQSPIHPFYQLGVGINSGIPTLITGFGLRSNISGLKRIAISGGLAMTWVKELDKLKVGDRISGTDDIDKDLNYQFTSPKPYIGIQYNF